MNAAIPQPPGEWVPARTLLRRHPRDWWLVTRVGVVLAAVRIALRLAPLPRILAALTPRGRGGSLEREDWAAAERASRYIDAFLRRAPANPAGSCLPRSLALYHFARGAGVPVRFHCGARRAGDSLAGHAWLTVEGQPFLEADRGAAFTEMFSYP